MVGLEGNIELSPGSFNRRYFLLIHHLNISGNHFNGCFLFDINVILDFGLFVAVGSMNVFRLACLVEELG